MVTCLVNKGHKEINMLKAIAKNFYSLILYKNTLGYSQLTVEVKNEFQF